MSGQTHQEKLDKLTLLLEEAWEMDSSDVRAIMSQYLYFMMNEILFREEVFGDLDSPLDQDQLLDVNRKSAAFTCTVLDLMRKGVSSLGDDYPAWFKESMGMEEKDNGSGSV